MIFIPAVVDVTHLVESTGCTSIYVDFRLFLAENLIGLKNIII